MTSTPKDPPEAEEGETLYFFPDRQLTQSELEDILEGDDQEQRAWAISHMLRYAQWDDIWIYVTRDEVRDVFQSLDLPENLRQAWARMLKIETPVSS